MLQVWFSDQGYVDAFSVRIDTDLYGMSENARSPVGFNQYAAPMSEVDTSRLGDEVEFWTDLPAQVQLAIIERLRDYVEDRPAGSA